MNASIKAFWYTILALISWSKNSIELKKVLSNAYILYNEAKGSRATTFAIAKLEKQ